MTGESERPERQGLTLELPRLLGRTGGGVSVSRLGLRGTGERGERGKKTTKKKKREEKKKTPKLPPGSRPRSEPCTPEPCRSPHLEEKPLASGLKGSIPSSMTLAPLSHSPEHETDPLPVKHNLDRLGHSVSDPENEKKAHFLRSTIMGRRNPLISDSLLTWSTSSNPISSVR